MCMYDHICMFCYMSVQVLIMSGPGFLGVRKLVLEELCHLVADIVRNVVLRQEAAQETKLRRFVFSQRSQTSNQIAHCTDQRSRCYESPEGNYAVQEHLSGVCRLQRALPDTQLAKTPEHTHQVLMSPIILVHPALHHPVVVWV